MTSLKHFGRTADKPRSANMGRSTIGATLATLGSLALASGSEAAPRETGVWIDDTGKGAVKIEICGNRLCGRIVWLQDLVNANGEILTDKNNPDPEKRSRTICGLPILGELAQTTEGGFDFGWVYDPKVGKSYSVALDLVATDQLQVTGYKGMRMLGKSFIWTRAKTDLPPCDAPTASPAAVAPKTKAAAPKPTTAKANGGEALPWADNGAKPTGSAPPTAAKPVAKKKPDGASQLGAGSASR